MNKLTIFLIWFLYGIAHSLRVIADYFDLGARRLHYRIRGTLIASKWERPIFIKRKQ
jgi:hypothetical protein